MLIPGGDYIFKMQRARRHLDDLESFCKAWLNGNHHTIRRYRNPNSPEYFRLYVTVEDIPLECALLTGDVIHNLRSSLDHLTYALMIKHAATLAKPVTEEMAEDSQFPIFGDKYSKGVIAVEHDCMGHFARKIGDISPLAQAEIKKLQPYQWGSTYATHPLWMLRELSNLDKHRLLLAGECFCNGTLVKSRMPTVYRDVTVQNVGMPLKGETEILCMKIEPEHEMYMDLAPVIEIVLNCGSKIVDGKSVLSTLGDINNFIIKSVIPPLVKFL